MITSPGTYVNSTTPSVTLTGVGGSVASITLGSLVTDNATDLGLTKIGAGVLSLAGANTYVGATTINAGELRVNGSTVAASTATVSGAGTLSGTGTVNGATTVQTGGTIRGDSGTGLGTLTTGNVTIQSGATHFANLGATTVSSNLALGTNTLDLATGSQLKLVGVGIGSGGFDPLVSSTYILATTTSGNLKLDGGHHRLPTTSFTARSRWAWPKPNRCSSIPAAWERP